MSSKVVKKTPTKEAPAKAAVAAPATTPVKRPSSASTAKKPGTPKETTPVKPSTPTTGKKPATKETPAGTEKKKVAKDAKETKEKDKEVKKVKKEGATTTKTGSPKVKKESSKKELKEKDPTKEKKKKVKKEEEESPEHSPEESEEEGEEEKTSVPSTPTTSAPAITTEDTITSPKESSTPTTLPPITIPSSPTAASTSTTDLTKQNPSSRLSLLLEECQENSTALLDMYKTFTEYLKHRNLLSPATPSSQSSPTSPLDPDEALNQLYSSYPRRPLTTSGDGTNTPAVESTPQFIQNLSAKDKAALRAKAIERIKTIKERNLAAGGGVGVNITEGVVEETEKKVENGVVE